MFLEKLHRTRQHGNNAALIPAEPGAHRADVEPRTGPSMYQPAHAAWTAADQ